MSPTVPVLTTVLGAVLLLALGGTRRGVLVGPLGLTVFMLVAIYGLRPLLMIDRAAYDFYGLRVTDGFQQATWVGLVAVVSLFVGYAARAARHVPTPGRGAVPHDGDDGRAGVADALARVPLRGAAAFCVATVLLWFAAIAAYGGGAGFLSLMFSGRSAAVDARLEGMPAIVMALPVVGALALAAVRVVRDRRVRPTTGERLFFWAAVAFAVVPTTALGTRRFLLPVVLLAVVAASARAWDRRVRPSHVALAVVGLLALAIVPFVRSAGSRSEGASLGTAMQEFYEVEGTRGIAESFLLSYDTEMFSYVAYAAPRLGGDLPVGWGRGTVLELVLAPLPAGVLGTESWSNSRLRAMFGGSCAEYLCPVPSLPGALYLDFAFAGVVLGMLVFGWFVHASQAALPSARGARLVLTLGFISFVPNVVRGNPAAQLAILAQVVVLTIVGLWLLRLALGAGPPRARRADPPGASDGAPPPVPSRVPDHLTKGVP